MRHASSQLSIRLRVLLGSLLSALLAVLASEAFAQDSTDGEPQTDTFSEEAFQTDQFTGAAHVDIPIALPPGTALAQPRVVLRYDSGTIDKRKARDQGQPTGLGWTLDVGGLITRDTNNTFTTDDDKFKLVFEGVSYDLVLVDAATRTWRTKDDEFWRIQREPSGSGDDWTLTTKDGTQYRIGSTSDSRAYAVMLSTSGMITVSQAITYQWLLSEVITPNGVSVRYSYYKQSAFYYYWYDQAVYPQSITYSHGPSLSAFREVTFVRDGRSDYDQTREPSYHGRERISAIEIKVNGALVRKYVLAYDYSIDRDTGHTWTGGAFGDLTLRSITQYGSDGSSALPPMTFDYDGAFLRTVRNGLGGSVTFEYDHLEGAPLHSACLVGTYGCFEWVVTGSPALDSPQELLGYGLKTAEPGTSPVYSVCVSFYPGGGVGDPPGCIEWGVGNAPDPWNQSSLLGYTVPADRLGLTDLYSACLGYYPGNGWDDPPGCTEWGGATQPDQWGQSTPLGKIYAGRLDRHRVIRQTIDDGRGTVSTWSFAYGTPALSPDGKDFRGHSWVAVTDPAGTRITMEYHQDEGRKGRASVVRTNDATDAPFAKIESTWEARRWTGTQWEVVTDPRYPGVTFAALVQRDVFTYDGDALTFRQTRQRFAYDKFGNVTEGINLGDPDPLVTDDDRVTTLQYTQDEAAWIVGLPTRRTVRAGLDPNVGPAAEATYTYDVKGNLTSRCDRLFQDGATPVDLCQTMMYDVYGNVTYTTDARQNTTTTTYDSTYQTFPHTVTTPPTPNAPSGLVTTTTYDPAFGVVLTTTDPNGRATTYGYDVFGRRTLRRDALGHETVYRYVDFGTANQRIITQRPDGSPDGLWSEPYFDGLGRVVRVRRESADSNRPVVVDTRYDARGLISGERRPYFQGDLTEFWTTYEYDPLGRLKRRTYPDTTAETITYNDWRETLVDRNGQKRDLTRDAYGRVVELLEPGLSRPRTTYTYDVLHRLRRVADAAGNVTELTYDSVGRKTQIVEPNMGTLTYRYDENGNTIRLVDGKGNLDPNKPAITYAYDALNRLTERAYPDGTRVRMTYDLGVDGKGRRSRVEELAPTGTVVGWTEFTYDALGRQASVTRTTDGVSYTTRTTYTPFGELATLTYPDGEVLAYEYDGGGHLAGIRNYAAGMSYNAAGQLTAIRYANGVFSTWSYVPETLRLGRQQAYRGSLPLKALNTWTRSWDGVQPGYARLYRGPICVADATLACIGTDLRADSGPGVGTEIGQLRTAADPGTVPVYRTHCYSNASGQCAGWGLSLEAPGTLIGYLATSAPDAASAGMPLTQSGGILYQGFPGGTASAYPWTGRGTGGTHLDHVYETDGAAVAGYTWEGTLGYLHENPDPGTTTLKRYVNPNTQHHYYSIASDAPLDFAEEATLGYVHLYAASGRAAVHRDHDPTTGDYRLSTAPAPAPGYERQAALGYLETGGTAPVGAYLQDYQYAYDGVGNVTTITDHRAATVQWFTYDELHRLIRAQGPYGILEYGYDDIGNRTRENATQYTYGDPTRRCGRLMPHAVTAVNPGGALIYDCNGNLENDGERQLTWDHEDRPTSITRGGVGTTTFAYGGDGNRVKKVGPTRTVRYVGSFEHHLAEGSTTVKHVFAGGLRIATRVTGGPNAGLYFPLGDHLRSLNVLSDTAGTEVQRLTYVPFGETATNTGTVDFDQYRFTGQEQDPETGLYYYKARYYNPKLGRFISPDEIVPDYLTPQSLNRYSYVLNNPLRYTDSTGHGINGEADRGLGMDEGAGQAPDSEGAIDFESGEVAEPDTTPPDVLAALAAGIAGAVRGLGSKALERALEATLGAVSKKAAKEATDEAAKKAAREAAKRASKEGRRSVQELRENLDKPGYPKRGSSVGPGAGKRSVSENLKDEIREEYNNKCAFCGRDTTRTPGTERSNIDHAHPVSRGGDNSRGNLQNACEACNRDKGTRTTDEYLDELDRRGGFTR